MSVRKFCALSVLVFELFSIPISLGRPNQRGTVEDENYNNFYYGEARIEDRDPIPYLHQDAADNEFVFPHRGGSTHNTHPRLISSKSNNFRYRDLEIYETQEFNELCKRCKCVRSMSGQIIAVDCSMKNYHHIPSLPPTAKRVDFHGNRLIEFDCHQFQNLKKLLSLDLSGNKINTITNCTSSPNFVSPNEPETIIFEHSDYNMSEPETFLSNLEDLNLSENNLTDLIPKSFSGLRKLEALDMSQNHLYILFNDTFLGLVSLKRLRLDGNALVYMTSTFHADAFAGLENLEELYISDNNHGYYPTPWVYPGVALSRLQTLTKLHMDGTDAPPGKEFLALTNLELLDFSNDIGPGWSRMFHVSGDFFFNFNITKPLTLNVCDCCIKRLSPDAFSPLPSLTYLDISSNDRQVLNKFKLWSRGLKNTSITHLDLSHTHRLKVGYRLKQDFFQHLAKTNLKWLRMRKNRLTTIDTSAIKQLPQSLEYIDISQNYIVDFYFGLALNLLVNLKIFDIHDQIVFDSTFNGEEQRSRRDQIEEYNVPRQHTGASDKIPIMTDFLLQTITKAAAENRTSLSIFPVPVPKSLEVLYASHLNLPYDIPPFSAPRNNVLRFLDLSRNQMHHWIGPLEGLQVLDLDLSENYCVYVSENFFGDLPKLRDLHLKKNVLGDMKQDRWSKVFFKLVELETIDLQDNEIRSLPANVFEKNNNLKVIVLSFNSMKSLDLKLSHMANLTMLDVSQSSLSNVGVDMVQELNHLQKYIQGFKLNILGNDLVCSCDNIPFLRFVAENPSHFEQVQNLSCRLPNGDQLPFADFSFRLQRLWLNCQSQAIFSFTLVSFCCLILSLSVAGVVYYMRWKLTFLYYIVKQRMHMTDRRFGYQPVADLFISYDQEDVRCRKLLQERILPRLDALNLSYLIPEVDFPAGPLRPMIVSAIVGAEKTLLLLSRDIFEDGVRQFEATLAIMHELDTRGHKVIPVYLERVDVDSFPPEIATYLHSQASRYHFYSSTREFWAILQQEIKAT